jgi:hypothetical protein
VPVELYDNGTFEVRSSSAEMGRGLVTVMRLTVAEKCPSQLNK